MSVHNSKKRPAPSQGGSVTKKANIRPSNIEERKKRKEKVRATTGEEVKSPVKKLQKVQKKPVEQEDVRGGKRAVPVTEPLDNLELDSEDEGASELDEAGAEMDEEPEVDGQEDPTTAKDPNGESGPVFIILLCIIARK
jgi:hypothetical protein